MPNRFQILVRVEQLLRDAFRFLSILFQHVRVLESCLRVSDAQPPAFRGGLERHLVRGQVSRVSPWWQPPLDLKVRLSGLLVGPLAFTQFDLAGLADAVLCLNRQSLALHNLLADGGSKLSYVPAVLGCEDNPRVEVEAANLHSKFEHLVAGIRDCFCCVINDGGVYARFDADLF